MGSRNSFPSVWTCLSSWSESRNDPRLAVDLLSDAEDDMSASDALLAWGVSRGVGGTTLLIKKQLSYISNLAVDVGDDYRSVEGREPRVALLSRVDSLLRIALARVSAVPRGFED